MSGYPGDEPTPVAVRYRALLFVAAIVALYAVIFGVGWLLAPLVGADRGGPWTYATVGAFLVAALTLWDHNRRAVQ